MCGVMSQKGVITCGVIGTDSMLDGFMFHFAGIRLSSLSLWPLQ